jgi:hypothetical protein
MKLQVEQMERGRRGDVRREGRQLCEPPGDPARSFLFLGAAAEPPEKTIRVTTRREEICILTVENWSTLKLETYGSRLKASRWVVESRVLSVDDSKTN